MFNVTLIQPDGYSHAQALAEIVVYLGDCIRRCGHAVDETKNHVVAAGHNVIVGGHLLKEGHLAQLPPNCIVFNSEQLEDRAGWHLSSGVYRRIVDRHFVWDYSARNLSTIGHAWKAQVPFYYSAALRRTDLRREPGDYLLFYGALPKRRKQILAGLSDLGVKVRALFNVYGDARDSDMFRCRAVLNLHKSGDRSVFEPVRCFYPLINRIPVISEPFSREPLTEPFERSVLIAGAETLLDDIAALCAEGDALEGRCGPLLDEFARTDPIPHFQTALSRYFAYLETARN